LEALRHFGRVCFAIGIGAFGVQYLLYGRYEGGLAPVPPWTPGGTIGAYVVGVFLVVSAFSIAARWNARFFAALLGLLFLLCMVFLHLQHFSDVIHNGRERTRALEPLSIAGAAFVLTGISPSSAVLSSWDKAVAHLSKLGRHIFALPMIIFGVQHFLYTGFIATLIPGWIPGHTFWVYFTGCGFIAAGACISTQILGRLAALSLGLMFLLWAVCLHAPRVIASPHNGDEWSSAFVALAFAGASFFIAKTIPDRP